MRTQDFFRSWHNLDVLNRVKVVVMTWTWRPSPSRENCKGKSVGLLSRHHRRCHFSRYCSHRLFVTTSTATQCCETASIRHRHRGIVRRTSEMGKRTGCSFFGRYASRARKCAAFVQRTPKSESAGPVERTFKPREWAPEMFVQGSIPQRGLPSLGDEEIIFAEVVRRAENDEICMDE